MKRRRWWTNNELENEMVEIYGTQWLLYYTYLARFIVDCSGIFELKRKNPKCFQKSCVAIASGREVDRRSVVCWIDKMRNAYVIMSVLPRPGSRPILMRLYCCICISFFGWNGFSYNKLKWVVKYVWMCLVFFFGLLLLNFWLLTMNAPESWD